MFYEKLDKLMQERHISAYRLSKDTGIKQSTLSQWKKHEQRPSTTSLDKLSEYFNISVDYFFEDDAFKDENNGKPRKNRYYVDYDRLKALINEKGFTLSFISAKMGAGATYISAMHNTERGIPDKKLAIAADLLGTTVDYLRGKSDVKYLKPIAEIPDELWHDIYSSKTKVNLVQKIAQFDERQILLLEKILELAENPDD